MAHSANSKCEEPIKPDMGLAEAKDNIKTKLLVLNSICGLSGLALLGIGIAILLQVSSVTSLIDGWYGFGPIVTMPMVVGPVVFLLAFFGCCGAIRENNCLLVTYAIFTIVLMIAKVALAAEMFFHSNSLVTSVMQEFFYVFQQNQTDFHKIETELKCCGPNGWKSYALNIVSLPPSCCDAEEGACIVINAQPGCNYRAANFIDTFSIAFEAVCIVVSALEFVAVVFSLCLAKHVRNRIRQSLNISLSVLHTRKDPVGTPCP